MKPFKFIRKFNEFAAYIILIGFQCTKTYFEKYKVFRYRYQKTIYIPNTVSVFV